MITFGLLCALLSSALFAYCSRQAGKAADPRLSPGQRWYPPAFTVLGVLGLGGAVWALVRVNW